MRDLTLQSFNDLMEKHDWPYEVQVRPSDFIFLNYASQSALQGHDDEGPYVFIGPTRVRPAQEHGRSIDLSGKPLRDQLE
jgi:hypothetical protein